MSIKLNKTQINVLAQEIYSELEKEANKYKETSEYINFEDSLKNTEEAKLYKKLTKVFDEIPEKFRGGSHKYHCRSITCFYESFVEKELNKAYPKANIPSVSQIENKIILKTIDSVNVDELIASVKESFKLV